MSRGRSRHGASLRHGSFTASVPAGGDKMTSNTPSGTSPVSASTTTSRCRLLPLGAARVRAELQASKETTGALSASFSSCDRWLRVGRSVTQSLNRGCRGQVNRLQKRPHISRQAGGVEQIQKLSLLLERSGLFIDMNPFHKLISKSDAR
jgi:hypothetical protein